MLQPMLSGYMICLILDFIYFINVVEPWGKFFFIFFWEDPYLIFSLFWVRSAPTRALQNFFVFQGKM
jgi:hypothetical protein